MKKEYQKPCVDFKDFSLKECIMDDDILDIEDPNQGASYIPDDDLG